MKEFIEHRFPEDISYGSTGGPEYSTNILTTISGHEKRNVNWLHARRKYNVMHGVKTKEQMDILLAFFHNCHGKATGFRYKDWSDFNANLQLLATADGTERSFQLIKTYELGANIVTRKITKPVYNSVQIFAKSKNNNLRGANELFKISDFSVDYSNGTIEFIKPPASGLQLFATFEFDVPARFDTDLLKASFDDYGTHSWSDISIIEIKL